MRFNTLHHIHKMLQNCWRKSFQNTQNPWASETTFIPPNTKSWIRPWFVQVRTLWTRCKLVILNVFIGQLWIFGHYRPWSMTATEHGTACSATFELLKQSTINQKTKWYYNSLDINLIKIHPFYNHFNTNYPIPDFLITPNIRILGTGADTLNSMQASYFERFHWSILNFWTLQTAEHAVLCSVAVMHHGL
jgi:hypothetical protein